MDNRLNGKLCAKSKEDNGGLRLSENKKVIEEYEMSCDDSEESNDETEVDVEFHIEEHRDFLKAKLKSKL